MAEVKKPPGWVFGYVEPKDASTPPDYVLGPVSGTFSLSLETNAWPMDVTLGPWASEEPECAFIGMTDDVKVGFPAYMAVLTPGRVKPWRLMLFDPSSSMYVTVRSYLTEQEADIAVQCIANGWSLDNILRPN